MTLNRFMKWSTSAMRANIESILFAGFYDNAKSTSSYLSGVEKSFEHIVSLFMSNRQFRHFYQYFALRKRRVSV